MQTRSFRQHLQHQFFELKSVRLVCQEQALKARARYRSSLEAFHETTI